ncbi:PREDICTED: male-specific lethal 1 homolog [Dufourea novaeangliae]|uniref:Male-specific lethal 1 like protein n=1 Tax=Dufourea novaeangliae TaxID=178035 RepID=A0A154PA33_DUFNO|nr:PREDICTED: male-specific lethal 1 homolog [Dufourea novaeangliae]KZC08712.1 Male-specific lethal 1 like protein [Dufourea novaeangliae]
MSSGSASTLVNGENKKENIQQYKYGNRKENENGAAGSTGSSIVVLAGDTSNATTTVVAAGTGTTASSITSNAGSGSGSSSDNGDSGCSAGSCGDGDSGSNSGVCVTGLTAGGVVGSVEYHDVNSDFKTPENLEEIRDQRGTNDGTDLSETEFQDPYSETCIETPIVNLTTSTTTNATDITTTISTIIEHDDQTATAASAATSCYEGDEEEDNEENDDNMVAAMNEHLSTTSATSGVRSNTVSATSTTANSVVNQNNSCSRNEFQNVDENGKSAAGILSFPCDFDHMYASMTDGGAPAAATATSALGVSPLRGNEPRQNDLTEVKHLKELLLLHLDLIQQQSEQIVTKDKLLAALRQENETLKLRLERMDRRVNLQKLRSENTENSITSEHIGACSPPSINSVNVPSTSEIHRNIQTENNNSQYSESFKIRLNTSGGITTVKQEPNDNQGKFETKIESGGDIRLEWEEKKKRRSDPIPLSSGSKRKRGVSCSSTVSNDTSSTVQDKVLTHETSRKGDRKSKLLAKKESFLTTEEHYYTAVGDLNYTLSLKEPSPMESDTSLEVPNWRVKIYTSCYTMEGTENLDDEIFNKRHLKLENDERRRKRWDVQRIREQRHIEKLKQRQERQNHQATCYNTNHTGPCPSAVEEEAMSSLWPDIEQIQSLQVDSQLPVTAFGAPIPSFSPSEFSLPWSNMPRSTSRRPKRSTGRRKSTRR